jgi:hypothetical protein
MGGTGKQRENKKLEGRMLKPQAPCHLEGYIVVYDFIE